ncbi:hypothetical protein P0082_09765 [Candidatus Haliotispira prima]|uniref:Uncharacterized protein n=1 Tax=Candidatus Haliotispira prima TaxID=3034016 RepID=A0ABY8MFQ3_9SPIO|nr:hypothetical protein P0082_09765 [Candidatus Haliotispira prima]
MLACAPLPDSKNPEPPESQSDISVSKPLYGPHFIHFEMTVNKTITTDLEVGFLISSGATAPQNPAGKQGYISRTFSSSTPKRQLLLFMHDATAYTETDPENTFENADFLQADTNYYLHIFNGSLTTEPQAFKTMSYEALNAADNSIAALDGLGHTDAASITRTIERKAGELTIFPAAIFGGNYAISKIRIGSTDSVFCAYASQTCTPNYDGFKSYQHYRSDLDYYTVLAVPNIPADSATWTLLTGTYVVYRLQINTITE